MTDRLLQDALADPGHDLGEEHDDEYEKTEIEVGHGAAWELKRERHWPVVR